MKITGCFLSQNITKRRKNKMKFYEVKFRENSEKKIVVEAKNEIEAARIASIKYLEKSKESLEDKNSYEVKIIVEEIKPDIDDFIDEISSI